jgi:cell pole-organizing protein PopZ
MNALNSKANEPSMEEILASIRRIISDDESRISAAQGIAIAESSPPFVVETDALRNAELQSSSEAAWAEYERVKAAAAPKPQPAQQPVAEPAASLQAALRQPEWTQYAPAPHAPQPSPAQAPLTQPQERGVVSGQTGVAVASSLRALSEAARPHPAVSLEDFVVEAITPLLRDWLDKNLPRLVEDLVREELDRIARHARG